MRCMAFNTRITIQYAMTKIIIVFQWHGHGVLLLWVDIHFFCFFIFYVKENLTEFNKVAPEFFVTPMKGFVADICHEP